MTPLSTVGDVGGGSDIDNYGGVPSTSNIWHANNTQRFTWGSDREAMTLDGGETGATRTGYVTSARDIAVTLQVYGIESGAFAGWCINVIDGSGAGQWARIVSTTAVSSSKNGGIY